MEDDCSSGYSGYSFSTPLFFNSLAQEAAGEWQVAKSKKTNKSTLAIGNGPTRCGATVTGDHNTCPCIVSKGRCHALSEAHYDPSFGPYDPSDFDGDMPMMMINSEE